VFSPTPVRVSQPYRETLVVAAHTFAVVGIQGDSGDVNGGRTWHASLAGVMNCKGGDLGRMLDRSPCTFEVFLNGFTPLVILFEGERMVPGVL
jgi:hypothetical protein